MADHTVEDNDQSKTQDQDSSKSNITKPPARLTAHDSIENNHKKGPQAAHPGTAVCEINGLPTPGISGKRQPYIASDAGHSSAAALRARREARDRTSRPPNQALKDAELSNVSASVVQHVATTTSRAGACDGFYNLIEQPDKDSRVSSKSKTYIFRRQEEELERVKPKSKHDIATTDLSKTQKSSRKEGNRISKIPGRTQPPRKAKHSDSYEIPDESEFEELEPPATRPRRKEPSPSKARGAPASKLKKPTAPGARLTGTPREPKFPSNKLVPGSRTKATTKPKSAKMADTARSKMKPMDAHPAGVSSSKPENQDSTLMTEDVDHTHVAAKMPVQEDESLEDFENEVVRYANDELDEPSSSNRLHRSPCNREQQKRINGAAQENTTVPFNDHGQSSDQSPERHKLTMSYENPHRTTKEKTPRTPAHIKSSPPLRETLSGAAVVTGLVDPETSKKSNIISFDKSGPRNQGTLSAKKIGAPLAQTDPSSHAPGIADVAFQPKDTFANHNGFSKRVPSTRGDLAGGLTNTKSQRRTSADDVFNAPSLVSQRPSANVDKFDMATDEHTDTLDGDDGYRHFDEFEETTLPVSDRASDSAAIQKEKPAPTTAQKTMLPPRAMARNGSNVDVTRLKPAPGAPTVPSMLRNDVQSNASDHVKADRIFSPTKRAAHSPPPDAPLVKRTRGSEKEIHAVQTPSLVRSPQASQDLAKIPGNPHSRHLPAYRARAIHQVGKVSRQASCGSHSVDINGSPAPPDVSIYDNATVLEMFSKRTDLSSDGNHVEKATRENPRVRKTCGLLAAAPQLPPPLQPRVIASNIKCRPASPQEHSSAITAHGRTERGRLLVQDEVFERKDDPFASSDESRQHAFRSNSTSFMQLLKRLADEKERVKHSSRTYETDDPDKTLVEPTPVRRRAKRALSISSASSGDITSQEDENNDTMWDIGLWRNALLPRQVNLFDELVRVSHQIMRHLVDHETAVTDLVEDYRARGWQIIEQMNLSQSVQYQKCVSKLEERKKRVLKQYDACIDFVSGSAAAIKAAKIQRSMPNHENDVLKGVHGIMARYC